MPKTVLSYHMIFLKFFGVKVHTTPIYNDVFLKRKETFCVCVMGTVLYFSTMEEML